MPNIIDLKVDSYIRENIFKKKAGIMGYSDVLSLEDMKDKATMVYEMASLPKYEAIKSKLKSASGVVNFVTNNEYPPLVEFILKGSFPPSNNDHYHMGYNVTIPQDYFIDAKYFFGSSSDKSDAKKIEKRNLALANLESILRGSRKKITKKWLEEHGLDIEDLEEIYGSAAPTIKEQIINYEKAMEALPKNSIFQAINRLNKELEADRVNREKKEKGDKNVSVLSDEERKKKINELIFKRGAYKKMVQDTKSAFEMLDVVDDYSKMPEYNNDGFMNWNPIESIKAFSIDLIVADEELSQLPQTEQEIETVKRIEGLKKKLLDYKTTDKSLIDIRNKILEAFGPMDDKEYLRYINNPGRIISLVNAFMAKASDHGKVIIVTNVENSILTELDETDKSNPKLSLQDPSGVLRDFSDFNTININKDRQEGTKTRGKRTIVLISNIPLSSLPPGSSIVEMNVAPVDDKEARIIVSHLIEPYTKEAQRSAEIKKMTDIQSKYEGKTSAEDINKRDSELSFIYMEVEKMKDSLGYISPEGRQQLEQMIMGMGQREAIRTIENALATNAIYARDENGILSNITFNEEKLIKEMIDEANNNRTRNALGLRCRRSKVKFDHYITKKSSEWGKIVGDLGFKMKDVKRINEEIFEARRNILSIEAELTNSKLSVKTKKEKIDLRDSWQKEIERLYTLKDGYVKDLPHFSILWGKPGVGKCLEIGTPVLMFDGSIKNVEDIVEGDLLMGPDSKPRTVLSLTRGIGPLYKVSQKLGDDYVCNNAHILSLQNTDKSSKQEPIFISAEDFCKKNKNWQLRNKGWKVGVEFPEQKIPIDPYWMGLWLGDGTSRIPSITIGNKDIEISNWLDKWASENDLFIRKEKYTDRACETWNFTLMQGSKSGCTFNPIKTFLRNLNLLQNKHIPEIYWKNSSQNRLLLLAGLIDSDGYMCKSGSLQFTNVNKRLAQEVLYLARSLGFRATFAEGIKGIKKINYTVKAYTVTIGGTLSRIPTKLPRKQGHDNPQKRSLRYGIDVKPIGEGEYFGFTIDGDQQFLLGDFTVTHNSVWGDALADICGFMIYNVRISEVKNMWYGNTGKYTTQLLNTIFSSRNSIFILDEIDRMMEMGHGSQGVGGGDKAHEVTKDIVAQFLEYFEDKRNELISRGVFVIMTTNHLNSIDTAMMERTRGDVYQVEASDDPKDFLRYLKTFLETERKDTPDDPWIKDVGRNAKEQWDYTISFFQNNLNLEEIAKIFSERQLSFRNLSGLLKKAAMYHNTWVSALKAIQRGESLELRGLPLTTENMVKAARIATDATNSNDEYNLGIGKVLQETSDMAEKLLKSRGPLTEKQSIILPTGKKEDVYVIPTDVMDILNGKTSPEEEITQQYEVQEEIDTSDPSKTRKRVVPVKPIDKSDSDSEESVIDVPQVKDVKKPDGINEIDGFQEVTPDKINKNKEGKDGEKEKKSVRTTSTDYLYDVLEKTGIIKKIQNSQINEVKNDKIIKTMQNKTNKGVKPQFDALESNGIYYFNNQQILVAPTDTETAISNPQRLVFK